MNELKGGSLEDMLKMLQNNDQPLSNVQRMALLKEIVRFEGGGTIDERRRAQALLRSLAQNRDLKQHVNYRGNEVYQRSRPAVGRSVVTSSAPTPTGKTNTYDISFYGSEGVQDQPFKGGTRDSKFKALNYMLGQALDKDIPSNNMVKIDATDDRRVSAYTRGTKGALKFQPYAWSREEAPVPGGTAKSYKNKAGNFQPIVEGKFTKSVKNPGDSLRSSLVRAATALEPFYRGVAGTAKSRRIPKADPISAIMTGADIGKWMRDNLKVNQQTSGRGGGRQALND